MYSKEFTTNDFRDLNFYYHAPSDAIDGEEAVIQILKEINVDESVIIETYRQPLARATPEISIDDAIVLSK
jgi:hypothetical protein